MSSRPPDALRSNTVTTLTAGQSVGLALEVESGIISLLAVFGLLLHIVRRAVKRSAWGKILRRPMDVYICGLLFAEVLHSIGIIMDAVWVNRGKVEIGVLCTIQGAFRQIGECAIAMVSLVIEVHTFLLVWSQKDIRGMRIPWIVMLLVYVYLVPMVAISATIHSSPNDSYMAPTPYWCWVGKQFTMQRVIGEYLWLWLAAFASLFVYALLYLLFRGNVTVQKHRSWALILHRRRISQNAEDESANIPAVAQRMMSYPAVYTFTVLPFSLARWASFSHRQVPSYATFITVFILGLSGAFNVLLLLFVRPEVLLLSNDTPQASWGRAPSLDGHSLSDCNA